MIEEYTPYNKRDFNFTETFASVHDLLNAVNAFHDSKSGRYKNYEAWIESATPDKVGRVVAALMLYRNHLDVLRNDISNIIDKSEKSRL